MKQCIGMTSSFNLVWCGVVWCGVVWCGVVWLKDGGRTWDLRVYVYESDLKFQCFMNPCTCGNLK